MLWPNSWLLKIAGRAKCQKTFTDDEAEYMTQSATHHWLYRSIAGPANYEVTKTVTDDHAQSATHHRI